MCNILFEQSLLIEPRHATHVPKFPRKWPQISLKSPLAKVKKTRILSELPGFHMEESPQSEADEPATPITPSNHMGSNSDFSIFAPIIIGKCWMDMMNFIPVEYSGPMYLKTR